MAKQNKPSSLFINAEYEIHFENTYCIIKSLNERSYTRIYGKAYATLQKMLELSPTNKDVLPFLQKVCSNAKTDNISNKKTVVRIKKNISNKI